MRSCPLSVRLKDGNHDEHVTQACRSLTFTKTAPGGHDHASFTLLIDRDDWPTLGDNDRIFVYDRRTAETIWEGYTNFPGDSFTTNNGSGFDLTAKGGLDRLLDDRRGLVYIDRSQEAWHTATSTPQSGNASWASRPDSSPAVDGLLCGFPSGYPVGTGSQSAMQYNFAGTDMEYGASAADMICGTTDANYTTYITLFPGDTGAGSTQATGYTFSTSTQSWLNYVNDGVVTNGKRFLWVARRTGGATNVPNDLVWAHWSNIRMLGRRMDRFGTEVTNVGGMVTADYVLASWVVEDLIGRMMPWADATSAAVDTTTAQIDQLTFREPASPNQVMDSLTLWEPDYLYEVLHTNAVGKHIFNYRAWPTVPRYEISTRDGYSKPSSDQGLCNKIIVSWPNDSGITTTTLVTVAVPELDDAGRIRHADPIQLPQNIGSTANASTIGTQVLTAINNEVNSASARVIRPVMDNLFGRFVEPWEIEPGYLVRVRETGDTLRLTQVTYSWSDSGQSEASLTLGNPVLSLAQRIKRLERLV